MTPLWRHWRNWRLPTCTSRLNRNSEAVVLYNQLIAKPTTTVPADAARLQLAALYEKTNPAEANKIYVQLKSSKTAAGQIARKNSNKNNLPSYANV